MALSPLKLERHYFDQIQVEALPERAKAINIEYKTNLVYGGHSSDKRRCRLRMQVHFEPASEGKAGYRGSVQIVGYFQVLEPYPSDETRKLVTTEGANLLFDAVREMICNLTARGPWQLLRLQNPLFRDIAENGNPIPSENPEPESAKKKSRPYKRSSRK